MTTPIPSWAGRYIGIPFTDRGRSAVGCDCYGLVRIVLADQAGITLPEFGGCGQITDKAEQADLIADSKKTMRWLPVEQGKERPFDVLLIDGVYKSASGEFKSAPLHMGVVVARGWTLHTREATDSRLERYDVRPLASSVSGIFRWSRT